MGKQTDKHMGECMTALAQTGAAYTKLRRVNTALVALRSRSKVLLKQQDARYAAIYRQMGGNLNSVDQAAEQAVESDAAYGKLTKQANALCAKIFELNAASSSLKSDFSDRAKVLRGKLAAFEAFLAGKKKNPFRRKQSLQDAEAFVAATRKQIHSMAAAI